MPLNIKTLKNCIIFKLGLALLGILQASSVIAIDFLNLLLEAPIAFSSDFCNISKKEAIKFTLNENNTKQNSSRGVKFICVRSYTSYE